MRPGKIGLAAVLLLGTLAILAGGAAQGAPGQHPVVYVMRHLNVAEDSGTNPILSPVGQASSRVLAAWLGDVRPKRIYITGFNRTRQTVAALVHTLEVGPTLYTDTATLVARVRNQAGPVLIVGHSNTVPGIIAALGGTPPPPLSPGDFCDIWRVAPNGTTTHMRIVP